MDEYKKTVNGILKMSNALGWFSLISCVALVIYFIDGFSEYLTKEIDVINVIGFASVRLIIIVLVVSLLNGLSYIVKWFAYHITDTRKIHDILSKENK